MQVRFRIKVRQRKERRFASPCRSPGLQRPHDGHNLGTRYDRRLSCVVRKRAESIVGCQTTGPRRPNTRLITKAIKNTTNNIHAICDERPAIPVNPSTAAINAIIRNVTAQLNIAPTSLIDVSKNTTYVQQSICHLGVQNDMRGALSDMRCWGTLQEQVLCYNNS